MELSAHNKVETPVSGVREHKIVALLCLLAAIHVFIFAAAFPFFNNVDEAAHFDLLVKYSHGQVPQGLEQFSGESSAYLGVFASGEYWIKKETLPPGKVMLPPWKQTAENVHQAVENNVATWQTHNNYEGSMPPLYYAMGGLWWNIGQWLGFEKGGLLYWLRFLNILVMATLIWVSYVAARLIFPENIFLRLGVPALLAVVPQTEFYSLGNDVVSALSYGLVFVCLVKWVGAKTPSGRLGAATGFAFAATYLAKMTNIPLLGVALATISLKTIQSVRKGEKLGEKLPALMAFLGSGAPPIIAWMLWCKFHFGDLTGSSMKMNFFGWTVKPLGEWLHHPIYSPAGVWAYLCGQLATYWQGEIVWFFQRMTLPLIDAIYTALSLVLLGAALAGLFSRSNNALQRQALWLCFASFGGILGFFAVMSVVYDFGQCVCPSRDHPYFSAGRMLLGSLIPFLVLFVYGLDRVLNRWGKSAKFIALLVMILFMLVFEIAADRPVFFSLFNWYHL